MSGTGHGQDRLGIIALTPESWSSRWQTRHQFIARLSRRFPTVWINPPEPGAGIWPSFLSGEPAWRRAEGAPELDVFTPGAWIPLLHRPAWAVRRLHHVRIGWARRRLLRQGVRRIAFSVWHPKLARRLELRPGELVLYHVNDEYTYRPDSPAASPEERSLLDRADTSYFSSRTLLERKGPMSRRAKFLPNGVDFHAFAQPAPEPGDLARIPHPRIGYTGWVKKWLDWDLLEQLARRRPDLHLVFVGDVSPHAGLEARIAQLRAFPNVHFLGGKSSTDLIAYPQHFDVCAMPYVVDGYTRYIYPLKLHEYFASGQPTIGSPIPALTEFGEHLAVADGPEEWSAAIDGLLGPDARSPAARRARQAVALAHDWGALTDRLAEDIREVAGDS